MATNCRDSFAETPRKRIKTENPTLENSPPPSLLSSKGKSKLEFETNCCGICFSEAAQHDNNSVSRGCIDSCDHYFCFVCIMEWAKVESKCPFCKRRFSIIRRPAKPPIFPSDRLIHVPVRDQVHRDFGNATIGPIDPYSEVNCSICDSSVDESLLLLCDLCDSAAHTYCVGLGATVPEGDWFCHDCTLLRDEHNKGEIDTDCKDQSNSCNLSESPSENALDSVFDCKDQGNSCNLSESPTDKALDSVFDCKDQGNSCNLSKSPSEKGLDSVFDIVREPRSEVLERSSANQMLVNISRNDGACLRGNVIKSNLRRQELTMQDATMLAARTLRQCRNVHNRIQAIRANWNSIQQGSLSFSSRKSDYGHTADSKLGICVNLGQSSSTCCSSQEVKTINGSPGISNNRGSCEIDKAWKMMDIAKSIEKRRSTLPKASKNLSSKHLLSNSHHKGSNNLAGIRKGKNYYCHSRGMNHNMLRPQMLERRNLPNWVCENDRTGSVISPSPINYQLISCHNVQCPVQHDSWNGKGQSSPKKISFKRPLNASNNCESSTSMSSSIEPATGSSIEPATAASNNCESSTSMSSSIEPATAASNNCESSTSISSSIEPATAASNLFHAKHELHISPRKEEPSMAKGAKEKSSVHPKAMENYDAKKEIQSLVKLNLKLLTRERKLEVDVFKEVARFATHSILVACGLEYPKPGMHPFSSSICRHEKSDQQFRRSTLMPTSCRECFYAFVKDVVNTVMCEKIGFGNVSR